MAFKMAYLAIYPMAVLAALPWPALSEPGSRARREPGESKAAVGWIIATVLVILVARPALTAPRVIPVVDLDLYEAGKWTRANVGQTCVDYLVADARPRIGCILRCSATRALPNG